ncbi:1d32aacc-57f2-4b98-afd6-1ff9bb3585aa [Sclerotinia trifoliorum]|uniref:Enhancer of polycomb-like protein n=1 Tax=Sclerotinia trifoliorum TaxID=28548 RepID=A0A8H2VLQ6_9HELO|nr:1d32aacc-57f2-4b98-afd6-1ff9bb3585aa [Sclerotinia trifoliorum]
MRTQPAGRVVRQKKLNRSTHQQILREDQIESAEYDSLQGQYKVETGVEKAEENEYHLQAALAASHSSGDKDAPQEIPAPPAQEGTDIDYESLYSRKFDKPATYIRFSQTVEECTGCQYNMTTEDDIFLKDYNKKKTLSNQQLSEDDFEKLMELFEEIADTHTPYAAVDNTLVTFETMKEAIKERGEEKIPGNVKDIYEYWKSRRQACENRGIQPSLKFETHQDIDEGDPYVCFRRREVRATRKTRARDMQITDKVRRLRKDMEEARLLIKMATERETIKKQLLECERSVFVSRSEIKNLKVKLGIKSDPDDELLINQKPQKKRTLDFQNVQRPPPPLRIPPRPDGRGIEMDMILLSDQLAQKENMLQRELEEKSAQHVKWNENYVDCTREPLLPVEGQTSNTGFRPATAQYSQYLLTPPSSVTSESFDQASPVSQEKPDAVTVRYSTPPEEEDRRAQPAYRRRIGRGGRLWIDRRGMSTAASKSAEKKSDRWKYDQDDDDDDGQPVYEVDPYDTNPLRFRSTIPLSGHLYPDAHRQRMFQHQTQSNRAVTGGSPGNNRAIGPPNQHSN